MARDELRLERDGDVWLGQLVSNRYAIEECVATHDQVRTYLAHDALLGEVVALKRFQIPEMGARFLVRFRTAAYQIACLKLPRLVTVWDYGLLGDEAFLTMEWMPTPTLATHLRQHGRMHPSIVSHAALWLADALADLHQRHVQHLGLTSANVFLDPTYGLKITDVGLNRVVTDTGLTMTGASFARSLGYLAPEQLMYGALSDAVDVYAFGVIVFEMLTGRLPFAGKSLSEHMASRDEHTRYGPPLPSDYADEVPEGLNTMVALCLHVDPARRPPNGMELSRRLRTAIHTAPEPALAYIARATSVTPAIHVSGQPRLTPESSLVARGLSQIGKMISGGPKLTRMPSD
jgi:eukaryotic-like serine/threonine-protein kinase